MLDFIEPDFFELIEDAPAFCDAAEPAAVGLFALDDADVPPVESLDV